MLPSRDDVNADSGNAGQPNCPISSCIRPLETVNFASSGWLTFGLVKLETP
jgi:hypothetical protein